MIRPDATSPASDGGEPLDLTDSQAETVAFLARPGSYDGATEVEQIVTHCSLIFLVGDRAYKLKRAIRFAALDYTTRARRERACQAELTLNLRTAPALYLGLRAITRDDAGRLAFDGGGGPIDHVVVMRRFTEADRFDRMAVEGRLSREMARALGATIAQFHHAAAPRRAFGGAHYLRRAIDANHRELGRVAASLRATGLAMLHGRSLAACAEAAPLLDLRRDAGRVRRCHGDLRLANICLFDDRPTLFDCIEFSEEIGCVDVLYDLAFLLMDLHLIQRGDLAGQVLAGYLEHAPDEDGLGLLPLFLSVRAATRCYALAGSAARQTDPQMAASRLTAARWHLAAAHCFLRAPPPWLTALPAAPVAT